MLVGFVSLTFDFYFYFYYIFTGEVYYDGFVEQIAAASYGMPYRCCFGFWSRLQQLCSGTELD
jgi:hypothetical protein